MKLENIESKGRDALEDKGLIEAIEKLPEGTIEGISGYGDVIARYEAWRGRDTAVGIVSRGHSKDKLILNIPKESVESMEFYSGAFHFNYIDTTYVIHDVERCKISK
ncbi:MAG: hypothetical protein OEL87_01110 [Nanoarchaeota archaeon]|nr:hypothetical protein [Nanoarchaeota archaeon]